MSPLALVLRKYLVAAFVSLRNKAAYPGNLLGSLLSYAIFVFVFSRIWGTIYSGRAPIAGYDGRMAIWYFIIAEVTAFGFGRFFISLAQDMKSGQVAYLLSRPYDFVLYHYADRMGAAIPEAAVLLALGLSMGATFAGPVPLASIAQAFFLLLSLLLAGSIQFLLQFSLAMTAFWVEENTAFFWIYQKLSLVVGTLVPLEFLPAIAQRLAWFTPFPSIAYAPARIAVAYTPHEALRLAGLQAAWLLASALLCKAVFALGRSRLTVQGG